MTAAAAKRDTSPASFREAGYWLDKTVDQLLTEAVAKAPDKVSIVADRADREQALRLTYKELETAQIAPPPRCCGSASDAATSSRCNCPIGGNSSSLLSPAARSAP